MKVTDYEIARIGEKISFHISILAKEDDKIEVTKFFLTKFDCIDALDADGYLYEFYPEELEYILKEVLKDDIIDQFKDLTNGLITIDD